MDSAQTFCFGDVCAVTAVRRILVTFRYNPISKIRVKTILGMGLSSRLGSLPTPLLQTPHYNNGGNEQCDRRFEVIKLLTALSSCISSSSICCTVFQQFP